MKTLKDLTIGSNIYYIKKKGSLLDNKDSYGNVYSADLKGTSEIKNLIKYEKHLTVNENNSRWNLCEIPLNKLEESVFENTEYIYFVNESDYDLHIRNLILSKIKESEQSIIDFNNNQTKHIESLRIAYYDFLNYNEKILKNPEL